MQKTGQYSHNVLCGHCCMHLLPSAATVDSQSVKESHAGAIHQSLAGLLQIARHFLIVFGRLSHYPLELRMTNQQLTQTRGTYTHANTPAPNAHTHQQVICLHMPSTAQYRNGEYSLSQTIHIHFAGGFGGLQCN